MKFSLLQFSSTLFSKLPENARNIIETILFSLGAACGAVLFMTVMNFVYAELYLRIIHLSKPMFIGLSFVFIVVSSLAVSLLLKIAPSAAGSGIPQVKAAYWKELGYIPFKDVILKFIAGIISIGGGASLGREGPTIFLGSGIASFLSGFTGSPKRQRRAAAAIGASAGLAAAFNTPLAAITFSIEELINDLNTRYLGRVVLAALIGALVVNALIGKQPAFELPDAVDSSWLTYLLIPLAALIGSFLGVAFQKGTLSLRRTIRRLGKVPLWITPLFGGIITWGIGTAVYLGTGKIGVFGLGYQDLSSSLVNGYLWWIAGILVVGKLAATIVSYGFGGCGGIFSPTLFIGGMSGAFVAGVAGMWLPLSSSDNVILSTVAMSACLGTVIRAPLTSTLIVFEMTHEFQIVPGLMMSAVISQLVARFTRLGHNFYDELLLQDGHELIKIKPPRDLQSWQNLPVSNIMNSRPVNIESLDPTHLQTVIAATPYRVFPYYTGGEIRGIITRKDIEDALAAGKEPDISQASIAETDSTINDASNAFINTPHGFIILVNRATRQPEGILTLHDLLRAQAAVAE